MRLRLIAAALIALTGCPCVAAIVPAGVAAQLKSGHPETAEQAFASLQASFEQGRSTEFDLLDSYKVFYKEDAELAAALDEWVRVYPRSSYAHLARGVYYRKLGEERRGTHYVEDTPQANLHFMKVMHHKAKRDLARSLQLNPRSYIAELHVLNIAMHEGDELTAKKALANATTLLPTNFLARARYTISLTPRWGGSYAKIDAFISGCRSQGVAEETLALLQAIKLDDQGQRAEERGRTNEAIALYQRALPLSRSGGTRFRRDYLQDSLRFCRHYQFGGADCS